MSWVVTASNEEDGLCHIEEFETREEAEKAVEKLKAWTRLKDKGFKFVVCYHDDESIKYKPSKDYSGMYEDLDLLFEGSRRSTQKIV